MNKLTWNKIYNKHLLDKSFGKICCKMLFARRKALSTSSDEENFYDYATYAESNLKQLQQRLKLQKFTYTPGKPIKVIRNDKERVIYLYPWNERILDTALYLELGKRLDNQVDRNTYAFRHQGYGVDYCQYNIKKYIDTTNGPLYLAKRDVSNFFPSIPHDKLIQILEQYFEKDDYLWHLLMQRVRFEYIEKSHPVTAIVGVPFGVPLACLFANLYLKEADYYFRNNEKVRYFRYADDVLIISPNREDVLQATQTYDNKIKDLGLLCKPSHHLQLVLNNTFIKDEVFTHVKEFNHLGLQYHSNKSVSLPKEKFRKVLSLYRKKLALTPVRNKQSDLEKAKAYVKAANQVCEEGTGAVSIIDYYLKHITDERQLKDLDRWLAEEILSQIYGGHKKGHFAKIPFNKLRELGLESLLHRQRLLKHGHIKSSFLSHRNELIRELNSKMIENKKFSQIDTLTIEDLL